MNNFKKTQDLIDRLRGIYTIPVNDGAGLLNGKDTYTRKFETPPINHEAADLIQYLLFLLEQGYEVIQTKGDLDYVDKEWLTLVTEFGIK